MVKVLFFGTHPNQFNGYSKVVYEICKCIGKHKDIEFSVYGFQNFYSNQNHRKDFPSDVVVYDAFANETPKAAGFGITEIEKYVQETKPDVCVVYNDLMVVTQCLAKLRSSGVPMKIIAYIDQVYLCQKKDFIGLVNQQADFALAFTPYWEGILKEQGITLPSDFLRHGFNPMQYYPIPKDIARRYFGLNPNDFIILNLNRNQPRKRWDICLKAFAEVVSKFPEEPIKMMIATALQGGWNLLDIYERELKKRNVSMEVGMKHLIIIDNPQRITDEETNILYNVADIGINTCDGEGFGLCNFEQAAIGIPQVVPNIGGFLDFFDESCAYLVDPVLAYYVDSTRDMVAGEALMSDYMDFAEGIIAYYKDADLRKRHGEAARKKILEEYGWQGVADKLADVVRRVAPEVRKKLDVVVEDAEGDVTNESLKRNVEEIDITEMKTLLAKTSGGSVEVPAVTQVVKKEASEPVAVVPAPAPAVIPEPVTTAPKPTPEPEAKVAEPVITPPAPATETKKAAKKKKVKESIKELKRLKQQISTVLSDLADAEDDDSGSESD